jgi:hypothetical protein
MVGPGFREVLLQCGKNVVVMTGCAVQTPFKVSEKPFAKKFPDSDVVDTGNVGIGNVGQ